MFCCLPSGRKTDFQTKEALSLRADPYENVNRTPSMYSGGWGLFLLRPGMAVCRGLHWK